MAGTDVMGIVDGAVFRFECPFCLHAYAWSAEQVMNTSGDSIGDECRMCGKGFRVLKPRSTNPATLSVQDSAAPQFTLASSTKEASLRGAVTASSFRYKVVPFIGRSTGNVSAFSVAEQLEAEIARHAVAGWEFYQLSDVNIEVQPGCIAGLLGATTQYVRFDQLIFRAIKN